MNKNELIAYVSKEADVTKVIAAKTIDAVICGITASLKKGKVVKVAGLGTFSVAKRAATTGRNPRTGEVIKIKACKLPKFKAGKSLKDAVN